MTTRKPRTRRCGSETYCDKDLIVRLPFGKSRFYVLKAQGRFRFLELDPQIPGTSTLYSKTLVDRWLTQRRYAPQLRLTEQAG